MESQCEYFMYFPAVPFAARELLTGEPGRYRALPRRNHLYLGETVRFLLVLRCRPGPGPGRPAWAELAASLAALASVSPGPGAAEPGGEREGPGGAAEEDGAGSPPPHGQAAPAAVFRECRALLTHGQGAPGRPAAGVAAGGGPDRVPGRGDLPAHHRPGQAAPRHRQGQDCGDGVEEGHGAGRAAGGRRLPGAAAEPRARARLPPGAGRLQGPGEHPADRAAAARGAVPPADRVRQVPDGAESAERVLAGGDLAAGRPHPAQLQRQLPARHARRLRAAGRRRLPPLGRGPRGRLLPRGGRGLGVPLRPQRPGGAQLPLPAPGPREAPRGRQGGPGGAPGGRGAVVDPKAALHQQHLHPLPAAQHPSGAAALRDDGRLRVPGAGAAALHRHLHPAQRAARLPRRAPRLDPRHRHRREGSVGPRAPRHAGGSGRHRVPHAPHQPGLLAQGQRPHHPRRLPGPARRPLRGEAGGLRGQKGEAGGGRGPPPDPPVPPQLSQHMKLKLQFTASVGSAEARALSRRSSPGSPAVRDLVERHQAGLGRSQSFSHQQPARGHLIRSGSVMERRAITPPVGSPVGRPLPAPPPERAALSLDKIAKRECKVLVVEPVK